MYLEIVSARPVVRGARPVAADFVVEKFCAMIALRVARTAGPTAALSVSPKFTIEIQKLYAWTVLGVGDRNVHMNSE